MKMEPIEGSETSAIINQTPGNYPKGNLLYSVHGKNLKSRMLSPLLTANLKMVIVGRNMLEDCHILTRLVSSYQLNAQFLPYSMPAGSGLQSGRLQRVTIPHAVIIQFVLLKMNIVLLETC